MKIASTDKGRGKIKLLNGTYKKFVATSVGEIQYKVLLAFKLLKMPTVRKGLTGL